MKKSCALIILASILSAICLIIELTATDQLQTSSAEYINNLQKHNTKAAEGFFKFMSSAYLYVALAIGFAIFMWDGKKLGMLCIIVTYVLTWVGDFFKMAISHPRPFWIDPEIHAIECARDFGAPSGHAITVGGVIIYFYLALFSKYKILSTAVTAALLALLAVDRNYIGVHFYFQVILGYSFGFFIDAVLMSPIVWMSLTSIKSNLRNFFIIETL